MTIRDLLIRAATEHPDGVALRFKDGSVWKTRNYTELLSRARQVSEICVALGVKPGDRVAIYRENSPEWVELYFGITAIGAIAVPVDIKLLEKETAHIFRSSGVCAVFCSEKFVPVVREISSRLPELHDAVLLGNGTSSLPENGTLRFQDYDTMRQEVSPGDAFDRMPPTPDSPASIIYTSGTTGRQKGAVLSHRNFISNVEDCAKVIEILKTDNFLLVLPLHHSFAFTTNLLLPVCARAQVTLVDNIKFIKDAMAETSPTVLMAVPLLLEKMLARIQNNIRKNRMATLLCRIGLAQLVGKKLHKELGGALRLIISGGAPIDPDTLRMWNRFGFCIAEGYGITETGPVLSFNPPHRSRPGTVGLPLNSVEIEIMEPDRNDIGEIRVRGPNVMQGYHNDPGATEECLKNGWYRTGDVGHFDDEGYLVISGRKKSMIVNREGKNIYPEEVEQQVLHSSFVLECLALGYRETGDATGERVGMIAVPDPEAFNALEDREGRRLSDEDIERIIRDEVKQIIRQIAEYKRPRVIQIRFSEFEKSATQKIKRHLYAIDTTHMHPLKNSATGRKWRMK